MPSFDAPSSPIDPTTRDIAATEGEPILDEPNGERPPLDLAMGDSELLNKATDPQINPDADPYDEKEAQF